MYLIIGNANKCVLETQALNFSCLDLNLLQEFRNTCGLRRVQCSVTGQERNNAKRLCTFAFSRKRKLEKYWRHFVGQVVVVVVGQGK